MGCQSDIGRGQLLAGVARGVSGPPGSEDLHTFWSLAS